MGIIGLLLPFVGNGKFFSLWDSGNRSVQRANDIHRLPFSRF